jgi:hypothetical protein
MASWSGHFQFHPKYQEPMRRIARAYVDLREKSPPGPNGNPKYTMGWLSGQFDLHENIIRDTFLHARKPSPYFLSRAQKIFNLELGVPHNLPKLFGRQSAVVLREDQVAPPCPDCRREKVRFSWKRLYWQVSCPNCGFFAKVPYFTTLTSNELKAYRAIGQPEEE